jgi:hypothetical protein
MSDLSIRGFVAPFPLRVVLRKSNLPKGGKRIDFFQAEGGGVVGTVLFTDEDLAERVLAEAGLGPDARVVRIDTPTRLIDVVEACESAFAVVHFDPIQAGRASRPIRAAELLEAARRAMGQW